MQTTIHRTLGAAFALLTLAVGLSSTTAEAALVSRLNGQAVYDTDLNLTWLANASASGMNWFQANTWAAGLTVGGISGWRLPTTLQPDPSCSYQGGIFYYGYNCTGSEMGHLFYNELGGVAGQNITTTHNANYNLFTNIQSDWYWSDTEYSPPSSSALLFGFNGGYQNAYDKRNYWLTLAVRSGDVAAVPVPAAMWLFGSGLLGLVGVARCKAA